MEKTVVFRFRFVVGIKEMRHSASMGNCFSSIPFYFAAKLHEVPPSLMLKHEAWHLLYRFRITEGRKKERG